MNPLIFDLDGTLIDSLPGIAASLNRALTLHGLPGHSHENVRNFIGDGAKMLITRALDPNEAPLHLESVLKSFQEDYATSWQHGTAPYPGIEQLLVQLKSRSIPLAVLSNKPHPFTEQIVTSLFPKNTFAAILGNKPGTPHKPNPTSAFEIAKKLNTPPSSCTLIGDSTIDLETAQNAGMQSIAVTWGYHNPERLTAAHQTAHTIKELELLLL